MLNVAGSSYTNITGADPPLRISAQPKMFKTIDFILTCQCLYFSSPMLSRSAWGLRYRFGHTGSFFISYCCRNIFIIRSGKAGQEGSAEGRAEGRRGRLEPDRDTGVTLWHVQIPSTELCLAQQHGTRKWATDVSPCCLATQTNACTCTTANKVIGAHCKQTHIYNIFILDCSGVVKRWTFLERS